MTDEYAKSLLSELMKISENMATKEDVCTLTRALSEELHAHGNVLAADLTDIRRSMAAMMQPPDHSSDKETVAAWIEVKDAEIARLTERLNRISEMVRTRLAQLPIGDTSDLISRMDRLYGKLLDRIEALEKRSDAYPNAEFLERALRIKDTEVRTLQSISQDLGRSTEQLKIDQADILHMLRDHDRRLAELTMTLDDHGLLRPAETVAMHTRPDIGASKAVAACLRSCAQTIFENKMSGAQARDYILKYAEIILIESVPRSTRPDTESSGASGSQPAAPSPESSGTEQAKENLCPWEHAVNKPDSSGTEPPKNAQQEIEAVRLLQEKYGEI